MHVEPGMPGEPGPHFGVLVGRIVVGDEMQVEMRRRLLIDQLEELEPFLVSMALEAPSDQSAFCQLHGREERGRSVPSVVMCHGSATALLER